MGLLRGGGQFLVAMVTGGACRWHRWIACPQKAPGRILFGISISIGCGDCDVPRLDVMNTANLCPAVFVVGLFYLLTVLYTFVWFGTLVHFRCEVC